MSTQTGWARGEGRGGGEPMAVVACRYATAAQVWALALSLAGDGEAGEAIEQASRDHTVWSVGEYARCAWCEPGVCWPCVPWQVATLARVLGAAAGPWRVGDPR